MMMTNGQEEGKWSDKKMEGDESMRTVECLRGRLLAERQSSRTAKEDSERMSKKLEELENLLKEEIKQRNKAQKKLKFLKKKLESLKPSSSASEQSSSCISSTTTLNPNDPEAHESKCHFTSSIASQESSYNVSDTATSNKQNHESPSSKHSSPEEICQNPPHKSQDESKCHFTSSIASQESSYNVSDTATSNKQNHESPSSKHSSHEEFCHNPPHKSQDESKCQFTNSIASQESSYNDSDIAASNKQNHESPSSKHSSPEEFCLNPPHKSQDSKPDDNSSSDLKSSVAENENYDDEENVDDSLAMVPFSLPLSSQSTPEVKPVTVPVHQSVREVLETLRHVRENIQSTMERRRMIRVGPV